ncbi:MAG: hypothetical protein J0H60_01605 [Rhizobiales bacterium]|nr:hypothetical protein [Hyphomicrobiales bacterium]
MPYEIGLEFAGDDTVAHAIEQRESCLLATRPKQFPKGRGKRGFGQDFRLAVARAASARISGSIPAEMPSAQASLWLSRAVSRFSSRISASMSLTLRSIFPSTLLSGGRIRSNPMPVLNVPLNVLAQLKCYASGHWQKS